ncbi:MAG: CoA pyrophosphatase [Burkholderiaceae bacterium]
MASAENKDDPLTVRTIFDPESVPHDPTFAVVASRGDAVQAEELSIASIRRRFASPPTWQPELRTDVRLLYPDRPTRIASVLIPLLVRDGELHVLLTERTAHLHDHAGQISFPGGGFDEGDANAEATALREAYEEIGLPPSHVEVIGTLPEYLTASGYIVTPVIGLIEKPFELVLDPFEVSEVFEVPLPFLMNPANHERRIFQLDDKLRKFYAMPFARADQRRYFIWGATAAMLRNLYHFLSARQ